MFKLLRMGCNTTHGNNFSVNRPNGYDWCLLLFVKSPAVFIIDGIAVSTPANTFILFNKNYPHEYRSSGAEYKNDWIHFELNTSFHDQFPITLNTPLQISNHIYISDLIQKIANEFYSNNFFKEQTIEYLMRILFIKTKEQVETNALHPVRSKIHEELIKLRSEIYSNPQHDWSIALMAKKLHISSGHLQNIYKNTFLTSCISDVIESRITYAKELLTESNLQIGEISNLCGYQNEVHFMRQFKKVTTFTPSQYRKLIRITSK